MEKEVKHILFINSSNDIGEDFHTLLLYSWC